MRICDLKLGLNKDYIYFGTTKELKPDFYSRLIEWYQGVNYSHSIAIFYSKDVNDWLITNSHGASVQFDFLSDLEGACSVVTLFEYRASETNLELFKRRAYELDGQPYSKLLHVGAIALANILGIRNPFADADDSFWCSEYVDQLMKASGLKPSYEALGLYRHNITPKHNVSALSMQQGERLKKVVLPDC